jgi:RNase H-like domain found in reverse transcriptase
VLRRLRREKLFCKRSKCHFSRKKGKFLGHNISAGGAAIQSNKVAAVMDWPTPGTKVELQAFLGLVNYYRRFILNFSAVVSPLTDATKGEKKVVDLGGDQDQAFSTIKTAFSTAPVLRLPDPSKPFTVITDASDFGIGGVLEQDLYDGAHPIAYVSRKLNVPERNNPTQYREFLAIIHGVKELCCYLHGSRFVVRTDHHPLRYLETQHRLSKCQVRWLYALAEYDYKVEYIQGKWNIVAGTLSRRFDGQLITLYTGEEDYNETLDLSTTPLTSSSFIYPTPTLPTSLRTKSTAPPNPRPLQPLTTPSKYNPLRRARSKP